MRNTSHCLLAVLLSILTFGSGLVLSTRPALAQQNAQPAPERTGVAGMWQGKLMGRLRVIFRFERDSTGALTGTMDVPQQGATGIPISSIRTEGDSLHLKVSAIGGTFEGAIQESSQAIDGMWIQRGRSFPLTLKRAAEGEAATAPDRPQTPEPPFPYEAEEVTFRNEQAGITLAGTLTIPQGEGPHPAVVLISGSGAQGRNSTVMGHQLFLVLADALTRRGIAVLRYDERGVGESTGRFAGATVRDLAADVRAAVDLLQRRDDIGEIGLLGWSEGGIVAPMVTARSDAPGFLVLIGAPAVAGNEIIAEQVERLARARGASPEQAARTRALQERVLATVMQAPDSAAAAARVRDVLKGYGMSERRIERNIRKLTSPGYRFFLTYNPKPALRKVEAPVLAIYGTKDLQVPSEQNAPPLRAALQAAPTEDVTVRVLPGLNHLLQPAETGLPSEYGQIETTIAPKALEIIGDWIAVHAAAGHEGP